jgi:hypothetical protein
MKTRRLPYVLAGAVTFLLLLCATTNAQDARAQLQLLQQMYKEGLITKDVYEQKQREVLGAMIPVPSNPPSGGKSGLQEPPSESMRRSPQPLGKGDIKTNAPDMGVSGARGDMKFGDAHVHSDERGGYRLIASDGIVSLENISKKEDAWYEISRRLPAGEHRVSVEISSDVSPCQKDNGACGIGFMIYKKTKI